MWMHLKGLVKFRGGGVNMYYLTGHIRRAWLRAGCFSPLLPPGCLNVTAGTPDLSEWISVTGWRCAQG